MKVRYLNFNALQYIKDNHLEIFEELQSKKFFEILNEKLIGNWSEESKFLKPKFNFYMPRDLNPRHSDFENAKLIYNSFINLTEAQASDERLWAGLVLEEEVYKYLIYRWKNNAKTVEYRIVFHKNQPGKRGLLYQGISRLWWLAYLTIDETKENKYENTEFTFKYPHIMEKMIYRSFSNSKNVRLGIIEGIKIFIEKGGKYSTNKVDLLYLHISVITGVNLIDYMSKKEITKITFEFLKSIN